jgi:hypothetical protein
VTNFLSFCLSVLITVTLGKQILHNDVAVGLEEVVDVTPKAKRRYGTAGPFPILFSEAWKEDAHVFSAEGHRTLTQTGTHHLGPPERVATDVLNRHPVTVLAVEETLQTPARSLVRYWPRWIERCRLDKLPDYVIVSAPSKELVDEEGLQSKPWRRRFRDWGYEAHFWFLRAHEHGGVVRQDRCMLVLRRDDPSVSAIQHPRIIDTTGAPRTARNMLKPTGIPHRAWVRELWTPRDDFPAWVTEAAAPCILVGETVQRRSPVFSPDGSLPDSVGALITTERGIRHLLPEELAKAKGAPPDWSAHGIGARAVNCLTSLHLWAAVAASLDESRSKGSLPSTPSRSRLVGTVPTWAATGNEGPDWLWTAPDLRAGGTWHQARVANLKAAVHGLSDAELQLSKGLAALDTHRLNYATSGSIHKLQLLWWEFPPEHWEELRNGCAMNFLTEPTAGVKGNLPMTEAQVEIAAAFIDELWALGVFEAIPAQCAMKANAPLFAVAKPGQPGQWRIIADMKSGGQNEHIGKDPTHLPRARGILERLYTGGWSAVVDASKFFHNFPTRPCDRPYLGCVHPRTGQHLWYLGLPMGSAQSPSLACRYGLSMLRWLTTNETAFQGVTRENGWRSRLAGQEHDPHLGTGLVRVGHDGLPAALIWAFVDDFKIHAPTKAKLIVALNAFMDLALRLGLICQPVKTKPPAQLQKYCGFLYDTTGIPTLSIPDDKRSRARAMIRFLRSGGPSMRLSRLTLAVVTGLLQSLVEATPQRIGQTFLRRLYTRLHLLEGQPLGDRPTGAELYYTRVALDQEEWLDLTWWEEALQLDIQVQAFSSCQGTLGISYGDGSGSGTGGTVQILGRAGVGPPMEAWMGTWRPQVHHFTSNWKELRTLEHTLERELEKDGRLKNATLFYFTDNMVSYYIVSGGSSASPELQKLIRRIKFLELALSIRLEVVHIPGLHMIDQRTDGLSRGLRFAGGRLKRTPEAETLRVFEALPATPATLAWFDQVSRAFRHYHRWEYLEARATWSFHHVSGRASVWFPAPEWAHQIMEAVVNAWEENPWHTEAFFVVPRVFQTNWGRVSKHIHELEIFPATAIPDYGEITDIPCVLLHLPCYVRSLPSSNRRLEQPSRPQGEQWHREQAEHVRGLS